MSEDEIASLVGHMMLRTHNRIIRVKLATAYMAANRLEFAKARLSTAFLDSAVAATTRTSYQMTPPKLRERKKSVPTHTGELPIREDILTEMTSKLRDGLSYRGGSYYGD